MRRLRDGAATWRARRHDERGAVALITSMLIGGGLMLGCVALTVDVGGLTSQRREIQNAADAVALSTAQSCAEASTCPSATDTGLVNLAHDNDADSSISSLCGNGAGLTACPALDGTLSDCPVPAQPFTGSYVRAYTKRHTGFVFAPGIGAGDGTDQQTCSGAGWGPLGSYTAALPITFSVCEWQDAVKGDPLAGTGTYAPDPPYPPNPDPDLEHAILLESKTEGACETFNGHDAPGGFGWLANNSGCLTSTTTDGWVQVDTGNDVPSGCGDKITAALGTIVLVPVYDCMNSTPTMPSDTATQCSTGNGQHLYYHIAGYAGFYLTGYRLADGLKQNSIVTGRAPSALCTSGEKCIYGFFVKKTVTDGQIGSSGTPSFGLTAVQLIG